MAGRFKHFEIKTGTLFQPLGFEQFVLAFQFVQALAEFFLNMRNRLRQSWPGRDIVVGRIDGHFLQIGGFFAGQRIEFADTFDFVAEEGNAPGPVFVVRRENVQYVALNAESAADKVLLVTFILQLCQPTVDFPRVDFVADFQRNCHLRIGLNVAQAINAGNRCDDDDVVVFQNIARGGVAHAVNLFVNGRILFNIGIGFGNISFGLIVIVVGNEIFNMVFGKELFHFRIKLGCQNFVRCHNQGRTFALFNDFGHGKGFAAAGNAEQNLIFFAVGYAFAEFLNRLRLVACGSKRTFDFEIATHFVFRFYSSVSLSMSSSFSELE